MKLHHWTHPLKEIVFDINTGQASTSLLNEQRNDNSDCPGFSASESKVFGPKVNFAIFRNDNGIVFYAGKRSWLLNDKNVEIIHSRPFPFLSRFTVKVSGEIDYVITYSHFLRVMYMLIDPTYDKLEQDADFFLEFVAENCKSSEWLKNAENQWCITVCT